MKQCPTCNRTYPDDTQSFCLEDGTPLVTTYDPDATRVINPTPQVIAQHPASKRSNPALYVVIVLLALLVGGGLVVLLKSGSQGAPGSTGPSSAQRPETKPAATATNETITHRVEVPANRMWTDTSVVISVGDTVTIHASGEVNGSLRDMNVNRWVGPDGWAQPPQIPSYSKASWVLGRTSYMCLTGKLGANGKPFKVGSTYSMRANSGGTLFLGINDELLDENGNLISDTGLGWQDNSGSFAVQITVAK